MFLWTLEIIHSGLYGIKVGLSLRVDRVRFGEILKFAIFVNSLEIFLLSNDECRQLLLQLFVDQFLL